RFSRDWSSDVCSSDLGGARRRIGDAAAAGPDPTQPARRSPALGGAAMRKPVTPPGPPGRPRSAGYGSTGLAPGVTAANSNTRISPATLARPAPAGGAAGQGGNLGLNSDRLRHAMVQRLRTQGITDERVLNAMSAVPRHVFVDEALASRAYEDAALPIGHSQTISQPWVVARMISAACEDRSPTRVLEVGAGCGYQAAVLAQFVRE